MKTPCCCVFVACFLLVLLSQISGGYSQCRNWCIADHEASDELIQKSLDWVCVNAKEACNRIQPGQPCYKPNDLRAVASATFNDYWQIVKHAPGAKCDIFGAAILVDTDPSHDTCKFSCTP